MTQIYLPFDAGDGSDTTEDGWRKMASHWLRTGVMPATLNELEVFGDGSGLQVKVRSGQAWLLGHLFESDAEETLAISANASGNTRFDIVVLRLDTSANTIELDVVEGTAGMGVPALTQTASEWEEPLGQVTVDDAAAAIQGGAVADLRHWSYGGVNAGQAREAERLTDRDITTTAWANLDTGLDLVLPAAAGDTIEVALDAAWGNQAPSGFVDVICTASGAHFGAGGASGQGILGWRGIAGGFDSSSGTFRRKLSSGDIDGGVVTLRLRCRISSAGTKTLAASSNNPLTFWATNLGHLNERA